MRSGFFILANVNKPQRCARTQEEKQRGRIRKQYQSFDRLIAQRLPPMTGSFFGTMIGGWTSDKIVAQLGRICKSPPRNHRNQINPQSKGGILLWG